MIAHSRISVHEELATRNQGVGLGGIAFFLIRAFRGADWITQAGWATLAVLVTTSWLLPWYIVWLIPLVAISRSPALRAAAVGMTLFIVLVRVVPLY